MFFILTTGRSGSASIARYLSDSDELVCLHEPEPTLIKEATQYARGTYSHGKMVRLLHDTRPAVVGGRLYGESNQKLAFIIPALLEAFSECKLIWLVRDGRNVVSSIYLLGWYDSDLLKDSLWQKYLINAPDVGEIQRDVWDGMKPFSKCCWYWSFVNRCIKKELKSVPRDRWQIQKLENINYMSLLSFLDANVKGNNMPWINKKKKRKELRGWQAWSVEMKEEFSRVCGGVMNELYPGWVDNNGNWIDFQNLSRFSIAKHYFQDKLVNVQGKKSLIYKLVKWPTRLLFGRHAETVLDKFTFIYRKFSGEN